MIVSNNNCSAYEIHSHFTDADQRLEGAMNGFDFIGAIHASDAERRRNVILEMQHPPSEDDTEHAQAGKRHPPTTPQVATPESTNGGDGNPTARSEG